jgi:SOS response regulatory protein OraA/RecX
MKNTNNKHNSIVTDYSKQKIKHLKILANKMLKNDEVSQKLKSHPIKGEFLNEF